MGIWLVSIILVVTLYLLITERVTLDMTAIGIMVVLMVTRILTPKEAVAGFANPAVITVGAMFLVSRAIIRTGTVGLISQKVMALSNGRSWLAMLAVLLIVGVASAFINNTPVVVLFIPVVMGMSCRLGISPSKYLIPISYVSILAGSCTLIGTSTNIIVSDLASHYGYAPFGMFELAVVGLPVALVGLVLILTLAPKLMPDLLNPTCELQDDQKRRYLAELMVPHNSALKDLDPCTHLPAKYPGLEVIELIRDSHIYHPCRDSVRMAADDLLLVKGTPNTLMHLLDDKAMALPPTQNDIRFEGRQRAMVVELIITPQSSLVGQRLKSSYLIRYSHLNIVAVERSGLHYAEKQIQDIRLKTGDILLVWCQEAQLDKLRNKNDWIVVEDVQHQIEYRRKAPLTGLIFGLMVTAAATGLADIMVCALAAVFLMVLTGCLPLKEAYSALQSNVLMLIVGTIALGTAMEKTGASLFYTNLFLSALEGWSPEMVLGGLILLTSISTQLLSNNATAVLLLPIAISTALSLEVNPKPFIMAVCFGASACFATPIGYQTNLMVYGPGGYRFSDYFKLGIPLNLLVLIMGTLLIPIFWPL